MAKLTGIEGIGEVTASKLTEAGIDSIELLLRKGATRQGRQEIAQATGLDEGRVLRFVNHADLMRINGIGSEYSELLEAAGVDSVPELAQRNAANLTQKMAEVNEQRKLVRNVPSESVVSGWVDQAKALDRVVMH